MPFNTSTGVYTPPAAATNATPGKTIASADWNNIFNDIAAAITQLGQSQIVYVPRVISAPTATVTVATTDSVILIGAAVTTIALPASASKVNTLIIIGNAPGIFSINNATVTPAGVETIDGQANLVLNVDYQVARLYPLATGGWRVL